MHSTSFLCITFVGFVMNVAWGVVMPSLWYFIQDKNGTRLHLGLAVSAFSLTQIFSLQILGKWADKRPMRESLLFSFGIGVASYTLYAFSSSPYTIIAARLLAGIEAGNLTVTNSFVAVSSGPAERTKYMARMNGINVAGFIIAPLVTLGLLETKFKVGGIIIDTYVASGLLIVVLHIIALLMLLFLFKEPTRGKVTEKAPLLHEGQKSSARKAKVAAHEYSENSSEEAALLGEEIENDVTAEKEGAGMSMEIRNSVQIGKTPEISKRKFVLHSFNKVYGVCFIAMFVQNFLFSFMVTAITPITATDYGFTAFHNSIMFSATSVIMVVVIFVVAISSRFVTNIDRVVIIISQLFMLASLVTLGFVLGRHIKFHDLALIVVLLIIGIPGQNTALTSIYSKFVSSEYGPSKLGQFTGILLQAGAIASIFGPLWAGVASTFSPLVMQGVLVSLVLIAVIWTLRFYKHLIPPSPPALSPPSSPSHGSRASMISEDIANATLSGIMKLARQQTATVGLGQLAMSTDSVYEEEILLPHEWTKGVVSYSSVRLIPNK